MNYQGKNYWALVLGGSSGFGLAAAKKLAREGMNLCIVHRDRRGAMGRIDESFAECRSHGIQLVSFNVNALAAEGRQEVLSGLADNLQGGQVRLLLHSIALGNLKSAVLAKAGDTKAVAVLAEKLGLSPASLQQNIDSLFDEGLFQLADLVTPTNYGDMTLGEEDISQTVYNMGTSLLTWVQEIFQRKMFAPDSRVLGLTSEGNTVAWKGYGAVSAAKCALESIARTIAVEFAPFGIKANILQPGVTDTPALRLIPGSNYMKARALSKNPMGRLTSPEDVAGVIDLMCRDESAWINGTVIRVDGGEHISG